MKYSLIFNKNQKYLKQYDLYSYLWFRYHRLFFKSLIFRGRKLWAFKFFISLKYELKNRENIDPFWILLVSLMKVTPEILLYPKKLGGKINWVPLPIGERKQYTFAVKWVIKLLKDKNRIITINSLSDCLISAIYDKGPSIEKKISVYKIADNNRHLVRFFKR